MPGGLRRLHIEHVHQPIIDVSEAPGPALSQPHRPYSVLTVQGNHVAVCESITVNGSRARSAS
jgi:hypothetical protein